MTVKELLKELQKEKYDTKKTDVFMRTSGGKRLLESVEIYDNEVHLVPAKFNGEVSKDVPIIEEVL